MKDHLCRVFAVSLLVSSAHAAQIDVQAAEGSDRVTLDGLGDIHLVMITSRFDTVPVAFVNAFFDTDNLLADVEAVTHRQNWTYDRSHFELPAEIHSPGGNEYGLVSGDRDGGDGLPAGSGTHIIDTLTLSGPVLGSTLVTFETGDRNPQVFGPAPSYVPFPIAPPGFPPDISNFLYLGDESSNNSPFEINYIPEPAALGLLALGGLIAIRRR